MVDAWIASFGIEGKLVVVAAWYAVSRDSGDGVAESHRLAAVY